MAVAALLAGGCSGSTPTADQFPAPLSISPNVGYSGDPVAVVITGTGFLAKASQPSGGSTPTLDTHHRAWLGKTELDVTWNSTTSLNATAPAGPDPGTYDLTVENAIGNRGELKAAYTVLAVPVFSATASVDHPTVSVGQALILTLTVRNSGSSDITSFALGTPTVSSTDGGNAISTGTAPSAPSTIAAGGTESFTWTFAPTTPGHVAINVTAAGVDSLSGKTVTAAPPAPVPVAIRAAAPGGLTATAVAGGLIDLSWTSSAGATGYEVLRGPSAGAESTTPIATPTGTSFQDTGLTPGTTFFYVVRSTSAGGTSASSSEASVTALPAIPVPPTGLTAAAAGVVINLSWTGSAGATGYRVFRGLSAGGESATAIATLLTATPTSFSDPGRAPGTTYFYRVQATNAGGTSGNSNEASATIAPAAPTGLTATAAAGGVINLRWTGSAGATGYLVRRGTSTKGEIAISNATPTTTTTTFQDTAAVPAGTTFFYVVRATNLGGTSGDSNEVSAIALPAVPAAPTGLTATAQLGGVIILNWDASPTATEYEVLRGAATQPQTVFATTPATTFPDTAPLSVGFYVVRAKNAAGTSGNSNEVVVMALP